MGLFGQPKLIFGHPLLTETVFGRPKLSEDKIWLSETGTTFQKAKLSAVFRFINIDKLAIGASPNNILPEIRSSARYVFIKGNLLEQELVKATMEKFQVSPA